MFPSWPKRTVIFSMFIRSFLLLSDQYYYSDDERQSRGRDIPLCIESYIYLYPLFLQSLDTSGLVKFHLIFPLGISTFIRFNGKKILTLMESSTTNWDLRLDFALFTSGFILLLVLLWYHYKLWSFEQIEAKAAIKQQQQQDVQVP